MDEYSAYRSAELAEAYDAVYADADDQAFWLETAQSIDGPLLELACGTGRLLIPLARAGREVTGLDVAPHMLARCSAKLEAEPGDVRERVTLVEADMTVFGLDRRFAFIFCACGSFQHLRTVEQQLACLGRCREHLDTGGRLVLDLFNPSRVAAEVDTGMGSAGDPGAETVGSTTGRRVSGRAAILGTDQTSQCDVYEVTYEITEPDGSTRLLAETFPMRFVSRCEFEHLLARSGLRILELYGDYDRSPFGDSSPGLIAVAESVEG